ncbi:glycosyltransferase family 61 protein [Acidisoma silvae]|uniref:Glycosyltransferase family 61 protein n=1 Tax=Acidisoma silvae TaxID=2802396 RepID=A0A963YR42_9PROT|nr:glycosyltransferase family 61 protein [Acidisoma silvae]MCB8875578.1 glycosyltransferase family 61 protein [Acidisoma silvae]
MTPSDPIAAAQADASPAPRPANMLAHISARGDVRGHDGVWLGEPGSGNAIEAVLLAPAGKGPPQLNPAPEYQIVYRGGLKTPWTAAGQSCGSQGYGLSAHSIRFRLSAESAPFFDCRYDLSFTDGSQQIDLPATEIALPPPGASLAAVRLHITPRPAAPYIVLTDIDLTQSLPWPEHGTAGQPFLRLRLLSPAFGTAAPSIRHGAQIAAEIWSGLNRSYGRGVFPGRTLSLREVPDATILPSGLIFDRDLNHVAIPGIDVTAEAVAEGREAAATAAQTGGRRDIAELSLLCRAQPAIPGAGAGQLAVMLGQAWLAQKMLGRALGRIIVQPSPLADRMREALQGPALHPTNLTVLDHQPTRCQRLILIDGLSDPGLYQSPLCLAALRQLAEPIPAVAPLKIFVSETDPTAAPRNQEEIEATLREQGFAIVETRGMTLPEQIALFKGATVVVGAFGEALANIGFCAPGTRVVALGASTATETTLWFLSQHAGLVYEEIRGQPASDGPQPGFTLSTDDIAYLAAL